ncbi:MAG: 4Fe-4S binding protein [Prevotella sp.]|nr:4Fe-4S binding protein [Prevotella sp.]
MIHAIYFSATETTRRIVAAIAGQLGGECNFVSLAVQQSESPVMNHNDIVILGVPVYAGRVPQIAAERLKAIQGKGQKAIAVCVYGNRDYDDALVELCDIAEQQGFMVVAAGAFIAEHRIFPKVATNRPDEADMKNIALFADLCRRRIAGVEAFNRETVKGNRPYLTPARVPIHPKADKRKCTRCGLCAQECPAGVIDKANPYLTDNSVCISCCRCISVCPSHARSFGGLLYKVAGWKFTKDNSRRREAEWF